jgi:acetyl esterase/lipase
MLGGSAVKLEPETAALDARIAASRIAPIFVDATGAMRSGPDARARGVLLRERHYPPQFFDVAEVSDETIDGPNGPIRLRIQQPLEATTDTVVYLHGGGWIIGDLDSHEANASRIAAGLPAHLVQVDYRLAPENPFPHGFEDVMAAVRWVVENIARFGGDRKNLILAGDSAGGNLAAAATAELLKQGFDVKALMLIYPATDFRDMDEAMTEAYLGAGFAPGLAADPRVSPVAASNLSSFPPTVIGVGTNDFLHTDNLAFASALNEAGVEVLMRSFGGLNHGFFSYGNVSQRADAAAAQMIRDLKDVLAGRPGVGSQSS